MALRETVYLMASSRCVSLRGGCTYAETMRAVILIAGFGLISGCAPEPQCVWECFGNRQCMGDDLYIWRGYPLTAPCRRDPMTCRRELLKHCEAGCSNNICVEDIPTAPPPPPVLPTVGTPCAGGADCQPAGRINTPEGPRQLVLSCGAMGECEDELYERCNGVDDNDNGVVDEDCALAATMRPVTITGRPLGMVAHATQGIALTTDDGVIHFLDTSLSEVATHTPRQPVELIATRDGFAYVETYPAIGGVSTDIRLFSGDGTPGAFTTITPGERGSRLVDVSADAAWLLTPEGLKAYDLVTASPLESPVIPVDFNFSTSTFLAGEELVLCLPTRIGWFASDGTLTYVNTTCAPQMTTGSNALWGFNGSFLRYPPRAFPVQVALGPRGATHPTFGASRGTTLTGTTSRALSAVAYPEAPSPFLSVTEGHLDGTANGYSAPIADDDTLVGGAQRGEVTILVLDSPTLGTRALRFAPR